MRYSFITGLALLAATSAFGQLDARSHNLNLPTTSPGASVTQEIGLSTITIEWHRPAVKGREVWGTELVPYGGELWRIGANENTTFTVSDDCTVNGQALPAGTYGLHAIASESDWTLIFSHVSTAWGSYSYNQQEDALRVTATPVDAPHTEWLEFGFEDLTSDSATLFIAWETKKVPLQVAFDTKAIVLQSIRDQLRGIPAFTWQGWYQAAQWAFDNDAGDDIANEFIEQSIQRGENWMNLSLKARMLAKAGNRGEAIDLLNKALSIAPDNRKAGIQAVIDEQGNE